MSAAAILTLEQVFAECDGWVVGDVQWSGLSRRERVSVVLRYWTTGFGDVETAVVARQRLERGERGQARFRLPVPPLGPVNYQGELIELRWEVAVTAPGAHRWQRPGSGLATSDVIVLPQGWTASA